MNPVEIGLHERACRGCELCVEICPTRVFGFDPVRRVARVEHAEDCIACLSCGYLCPSHAITHAGHHVVKDFHRDLEFCRRAARFL